MDITVEELTELYEKYGISVDVNDGNITGFITSNWLMERFLKVV